LAGRTGAGPAPPPLAPGVTGVVRGGGGGGGGLTGGTAHAARGNVIAAAGWWFETPVAGIVIFLGLVVAEIGIGDDVIGDIGITLCIEFGTWTGVG
jgi:hypothetical protein